MARIRPKVKTEPPSSGESIRYQTISSRKKANPTIPHAASTKRREGDATAVASPSGASTTVRPRRRESSHAPRAAVRFSAHATKSVPRLPSRSKP